MPAEHLTAKPSGVSWDVAGGLFVAGATAYAAVRAIKLGAENTVAVAGTAGGVGSIAVQLTKRAGATIWALLGPPMTRGCSATACTGQPRRRPCRSAQSRRTSGSYRRVPRLFGGGYVALALNDLGVATQRVNTIIDFAAVEKYGVQSASNGDATDARVLAELAEVIAHGEMEVPIATTYPLDDVRLAYRALEQRHTRGKGVRDIYRRQC